MEYAEMEYAEEENRMPEQRPPARLRPNGKQRRLLALVFKEGLSFADAVSQLHIRPQTIVKWLRQPVFIRYMFDAMTKFYVNAQIERLRGVSNAVSSLSSAELSDARRKACVDLLRLHKVFSLDSPESWGPLSQSEGPRLDSFGPRSEPFGPRSEPFGPPKNTPEPRFSTKNEHSAPFSTENPPKSGPIRSGPTCRISSPAEYRSPYRHFDPFDPELSNLDWFQKMFEDWDTKHPDDPDVILFRRFRAEKNAGLQDSSGDR